MILDERMWLSEINKYIPCCRASKISERIEQQSWQQQKKPTKNLATPHSNIK